MGTGRRLRQEKPGVRLISMQPDGPFHGLEGLKHMDSAIVPPIYDPTLADEAVTVDTDEAWAMVRRLAREEGVFVGVSGAAALVATLRAAAAVERGVFVTIIPDSGERYLSERQMERDMTVADVALSAEARPADRAHAAETYPHECCGALYGEADRRRLHRGRSGPPSPTRPSEGPRRRFLIQPSDYRAAEAHARDTKRALIGFYHSHPDHPAQPSQYDLDHAWPNMLYTITSVREGRVEVTTAWQLREDRSQFDERRSRSRRPLHARGSYASASSARNVAPSGTSRPNTPRSTGTISSRRSVRTKLASRESSVSV